MSLLPRQQLSHVSTAEEAIECIRKAKHIVVITGAGISVSCGIPDFRSANGIYNTIDCEALNIPSPELIFDLSFFEIDPVPFYTFSQTFYNNPTPNPSATHKFIHTLENKKKLLRNYTQNVDGIERLVGISNLVECHGNMHSFRCIKCKRKGDSASILANLLSDGLPPKCKCQSYMKPDIVFFGESFPSIMDKTMEKDLLKVDLVMVIGTSLKVGGSVVEFLKKLDPSIPQILINKEEVSLPVKVSAGFDVTLLGCCDDIMHLVSRRLEWVDEDEECSFGQISDRVYELIEGEYTAEVIEKPYNGDYENDKNDNINDCAKLVYGDCDAHSSEARRSSRKRKAKTFDD